MQSVQTQLLPKNAFDCQCARPEVVLYTIVLCIVVLYMQVHAEETPSTSADKVPLPYRLERAPSNDDMVAARGFLDSADHARR